VPVVRSPVLKAESTVLALAFPAASVNSVLVLIPLSSSAFALFALDVDAGVTLVDLLWLAVAVALLSVSSLLGLDGGVGVGVAAEAEDGVVARVGAATLLGSSLVDLVAASASKIANAPERCSAVKPAALPINARASSP
jgi:hypothetical protein